MKSHPEIQCVDVYTRTMQNRNEIFISISKFCRIFFHLIYFHLKNIKCVDFTLYFTVLLANVHCYITKFWYGLKTEISKFSRYHICTGLELNKIKRATWNTAGKQNLKLYLFPYFYLHLKQRYIFQRGNQHG